MRENMTIWDIDPLLWRKQIRRRRREWEDPKYRTKGSPYPTEWTPHFSEELAEVQKLASQLKKLGLKKPWRRAVTLVLGEFDPWGWLKGWERRPGITIVRERGPLTEIEEWAIFKKGAILFYYSYTDECEGCPYEYENKKCDTCHIRKRNKITYQER